MKFILSDGFPDIGWRSERIIFRGALSDLMSYMAHDFQTAVFLFNRQPFGRSRRLFFQEIFCSLFRKPPAHLDKSTNFLKGQGMKSLVLICLRYNRI